MANKKLKEKKKKEREISSRNKVVKIREAKRKKDKAEKIAYLFNSKHKDKLEPFVKDETRKRKVREQLEHNIKILKALEEEYDNEMALIAQRQEQLDGCETMEEKIEKAKTLISIEDREKIEKVKKMIAEEENRLKSLDDTTI